ncbi:hypothetical protein QYM36_000162 [Artemia franciscana]|uniref:PiggyBac transposable element-derived protein domain-containing protein n=1 Tax=Artemia franciscana TaxID=6661 RepID=A0AA88IC30_ARTSF|nr:hypothetical protein QYM36_000162 [Artemia franciscana]
MVACLIKFDLMPELQLMAISVATQAKQDKLTDKKAIKIIFDDESDDNYEKSDLDLTSDKEDGRDPSGVSSEVADTFFRHNVIAQPSAEVVSESDSNDEEPPPSCDGIKTYSCRQLAANISPKPTDSSDMVRNDNCTPSVNSIAKKTKVKRMMLWKASRDKLNGESVPHFYRAYKAALSDEAYNSVDEMMLPFKGYVYGFGPYRGSLTQTYEHELRGDVVIRLCRGLEKENAKVYFNNFFTSIPLLETLAKGNAYSTNPLGVKRLGDAADKLISQRNLVPGNKYDLLEFKASVAVSLLNKGMVRRRTSPGHLSLPKRILTQSVSKEVRLGGMSGN